MGASGTDPYSRGSGASSDATLRVVLASDSGGTASLTEQQTQTARLALLATEAKQPSLGTAGTPSANVLSMQGVSGGTPLKTSAAVAVITPVWTVDTVAYSAGDCVGTKIALANAVAAAGGAALLHQILILDRANQKPTGSILIFNADPAAATTTDNAAFVFSTDDLKCIAKIPVATSDYTTINSKAMADLSNLGRLCKSAATTSLWAVFVTDGAPDFVLTTDFQIVFKFLPVDA